MNITDRRISPAVGEFAVQEARRLRIELEHIARARRCDSERFSSDTAFADWAQSRARAAIDKRVTYGAVVRDPATGEVL